MDGHGGQERERSLVERSLDAIELSDALESVLEKLGPPDLLAMYAVRHSVRDPVLRCFELLRPKTERQFAGGVSFDVSPRYQVTKALQQFGCTCVARDTATGTLVVIRRISDAFSDIVACKQLLRELRLLRCVGHHSQVHGLLDIMMPPAAASWKDVYFVQPHYDATWHHIIYSHQNLLDDHVKWFMFQLLRGLAALHQVGVVHRDIKPGNILATRNDEHWISGFGSARWINHSSNEAPAEPMTKYVVTRWYRAPELLVGNSKYGPAVDIWSAGCVCAELLGRRPLLPGKDYLHQLRLTMEFVGTPSEQELKMVRTRAAVAYISQLPKHDPIEFSGRFPEANPEVLDLLWHMLTFDPASRISAAQAMEHPYFAELHGEMGPCDDEQLLPPPNAASDWDCKAASPAELRAMMWAEMRAFHPEAGPAPPAGYQPRDAAR